MPRINQLPTASSVAQTDVLAIDTPNKTYQVPRSVLAPAPFIATIPTGQWSGSGNDRYITVQASNVTADSVLVPHYDNASGALLNGPVWCVPAAGSFTVHTSAIPSGTVSIMIQFVGTLGEANYQVLADVYSKSQVDSIVQQSMAFVCTQLRLPQSVTIPGNSNGTLLDNTDLRSLTYDALDHIPTSGVIKGIMYMWCSGGAGVGAYAVDALVFNGLATLILRNPSTSSFIVSAVRLLVMLQAN